MPRAFRQVTYTIPYYIDKNVIFHLSHNAYLFRKQAKTLIHFPIESVNFAHKSALDSPL